MMSRMATNQAGDFPILRYRYEPRRRTTGALHVGFVENLPRAVGFDLDLYLGFGPWPREQTETGDNGYPCPDTRAIQRSVENVHGQLPAISERDRLSLQVLPVKKANSIVPRSFDNPKSRLIHLPIDESRSRGWTASTRQASLALSRRPGQSPDAPHPVHRRFSPARRPIFRPPVSCSGLCSP